MLDIPAATSALKVHYARTIKSIVPDHNKYPLWKLLVKKKGKLVPSAFGSAFVVPIETEEPQAISAGTPAAAETKAATSGEGGESEFKAFTVTPKLLYSAGIVTGAAILQTEGDTNSFIDAMAKSIDKALESLQSRLALHLHGSGKAELGKLTADPGTGTTCTMARGAKRRLRRGMDVVFRATLAGANRAGGSRRITAVNADGTFEVNAAMDAAVASGDFVVLTNESTASSATADVITGLEGWNPETAPTTGDAHFGVDRSTNYRLGGQRLDKASFGSVKEGLIHLAMEMDAEGRFPKIGVANPVNWAEVAVLQEGVRDYNDEQKKMLMGFQHAAVATPGGIVPIVADPSAPIGKIRLIDTDCVYIVHAGDDVAHLIQEDGNLIRKVTGSDAFSVGCRSMANMVADDPSGLGLLYNC
jgi:hypothetical protein